MVGIAFDERETLGRNPDPAVPADPSISAAAWPAMSIYHEPWWLDIATDGQWSELIVEDGGAAVRLRYPLQLSNGRMISRMPTLIRTLGPEFLGLRGKPVTMQRHRMTLIRKLIEELTGLAYFEQIFDPRVEEAAIFARHRDFGVTVEYSYRAPAGISEAESLGRMMRHVRNMVRVGGGRFQVTAIDSADLFCRFHDACLRGRPNFHGSDRMRRLIMAIQARGSGQMLAAVGPDGAVAAALAIVWDRDAVRNLIGARDRETSGNAALTLLMWHAMRIAMDRGLAFDFDGAMTPGQLAFLSAFGAELVQRLVVWRSEPGYFPPQGGPARIARG